MIEGPFSPVFQAQRIHTNFVFDLLSLIWCICLLLSDCKLDTSQSGSCNGQNVDSFCKTSGEGESVLFTEFEL